MLDQPVQALQVKMPSSGKGVGSTGMMPRRRVFGSSVVMARALLRASGCDGDAVSGADHLSRRQDRPEATVK